MKTLLLISILAISASCGKAKSSRRVNQIFVKGNPLTMIKDTQKDKTSFITTATVSDFNNFALTNLYIFAEKELISQEESEDIEAGQEAEDSDQTQDAATVLNFKQLNSTEYLMSDASGGIAFGFETVGTKLNISSLTLGKDTFPVTIEHYSLSADKSKMSFLFRLTTSGDGEVLVNASFYRHSAKKPTTKVSSAYHYIYGPGVVVPWKLDATRKVTVDICPSMSQKLSSTRIKSALEAWESPFAFKTNKLDIVLNELTVCKPFSDVDQHSIHFIDSYLTIQQEDAYNAGFTMIHSDLSAGNIFDADIVILGSEIAKDESFDANEFGRVWAHELGHFLGLDQQFDGTRSIMSYKSFYSLSA